MCCYGRYMYRRPFADRSSPALRVIFKEYPLFWFHSLCCSPLCWSSNNCFCLHYYRQFQFINNDLWKNMWPTAYMVQTKQWLIWFRSLLPSPGTSYPSLHILNAFIVIGISHKYHKWAIVAIVAIQRTTKGSEILDRVSYWGGWKIKV